MKALVEPLILLCLSLLLVACGGEEGDRQERELVDSDIQHDVDSAHDTPGEEDTDTGPRPSEVVEATTPHCRELETAYRACELFTVGAIRCVEPTPVEAEQANCELLCVQESGCADLRLWACSETVPPSLGSCYEACTLAEASFTCANGAGSIPLPHQCDGLADCADGSDEAACPELACTDGQGSVPASYACDGEPDCADGSDEESCPTFACGDGTSVPETSLCDYRNDCPDGSDEQACPGLVCSDGVRIPSAWVCDGEADCGDLGDEAQCPTLAVPVCAG